MNTKVFKIIGVILVIALIATIFFPVYKSGLTSDDIQKVVGLAVFLAMFGVLSIYIGFFMKEEFVHENENILIEEEIAYQEA